VRQASQHGHAQPGQGVAFICHRAKQQLGVLTWRFEDLLLLAMKSHAFQFKFHIFHDDMQAAHAAHAEARAGGLEPIPAAWRPRSLRAELRLGVAAVALVDDRYGHNSEVAAARLQVIAAALPTQATSPVHDC